MTASIRNKHTSPAGRRFGWRRDLPDFRDKLYGEVHPTIVQLPPKTDLFEHFPFVFDQKDSSSCTAQSGCYIYSFLKGVKTIEEAYSRLFYYWNERVVEGDTDQDAGASIRDGIKQLAAKGVCLEKEWAFDLSKMYDKPTDQAFKNAIPNKIHSYSSLTKRMDYRQCLAKGFPFTIGITCYDGLDGELVTNTGILGLPGPSESVTGGHAITVIGYDTDFYNNETFKKSGLDTKQYPYTDVYHILNSWGPDWGDKGTFWVPAAYIENDNLSSDAWTYRIS